MSLRISIGTIRFQERILGQERHISDPMSVIIQTHNEPGTTGCGPLSIYNLIRKCKHLHPTSKTVPYRLPQRNVYLAA
jgi:hypothetical protein